MEQHDQFYDSYEKVEQWLKAMKIQKYTINTDLTVDVDGDVNLEMKKISLFPVQFGEINGSFLCSYNSLTSLKGAPRIIAADFWANGNRLLTSLDNGPVEVGGDYLIVDCGLTSLKGAPREVGENFLCDGNKLTSLEGGPKEVGMTYNCSLNNLKSLKGAPKEVGGDFICSINKLTKLDCGTMIVGGNFMAKNNDFLQSIPEHSHIKAKNFNFSKF